jgi:hypothetical protein
MPSMKKPVLPLTTPLLISPQPDQPNLSKGQALFNALVKDVEKRREMLAEWQAFMVTHDQKVAKDYLPLLDTFRERQAEMVRVLDEALAQKELTKSERGVVEKIICSVAEQLIVETDDAAIKEIYNKYSDIDFDAEEAAAVDSMKEAMEAMFGVDLGDINDGDLNSPEEIFARVQAQIEREQQRRLDELAQHSSRRKTAKQTAKQRAKEEKLKAESDETNLSLREIYRKLVSALHPDREPDPAERVRKTALMQRVNQAYEKKDLLKLLELQLAIEQIDASAIANLSDDRLKHFNKILREQLNELAQEILAVQMPLREQLNMSPTQPIAMKTVMPRLMQDIAHLKSQIRRIENEIQMPKNPVAFKLWIKTYRQALRERDRAKWEGDFEGF